MRDRVLVERRADLGVAAVLVATLATGCGLLTAPALVVTAVWTALAVAFLGLVLAGIAVHRPVRRRPWVLFALMIAAQTPTSALLWAIESERVAAAPANMVLGVLLGLSLTLGLAGGVLLVPGGRGSSYRRPLVVVALAITVATVGSAWGVARAMVEGVPSTAAVVNGPLLAVCAAVAVGASLLHTFRCARGGLWSEAILVPFPSLIAAANVPAALGVGDDLAMRISTVGTMVAFGLVGAAALHPTMTEVARGTVLRLADAPLGLTTWFVGVNAAVAPLVLGAEDHPWLVPLYAAGGGATAMVYASQRTRLWKRAGGADVIALGTAATPGAPGHAADHLTDDLRAALATSALSLHYQPIVRLADGLIVGAEALLRWHHPTLGNIPPDVFLPVAEAGGFFDDLGDWVIGRGVSEGSQLLAALALDEAYLSINVAPSQIEADGFVAALLSHLRGAGLSGRGFVLELTEQARFADLDRARRVIGQLQQLGVQVAMDDFGAGNSSLGTLNALEIDIVKIDREVVAAMTSPRGYRVLRTAVDLLNDLGVTVIAEGIEDIASVATLTGLTVSHGQGFGLGRPQPLDQLLEQLRVSPVIDVGTTVVRPLRVVDLRR